MERLRSAIVGCGAIAGTHALVLSNQPTAELSAFCDIVPEKAGNFASKYGGRAYSSLEEMLSKERVDVLHICTPHPLHTPMAKFAAGRGINVFTEKPPAVNEEQWEEFSALKDSHVRVGICFQNRYNPGTEFIKSLLAGGKTGKILSARAFVTWRRDAPYYTESSWRGGLETEGGGVLINQAVHTLDLLCWFLGRAKSVDARMANHHLKGSIEVEDTFEAYLEFQNATALFYATTAYGTDSPVFLELLCENCVLRLEEPEVSVKWRDGSLERHRLASPLSPTGKAYWGASHGVCIADFYDSIINDRIFRNDIDSVENTAELLLAAYRSAREEREIAL